MVQFPPSELVLDAEGHVYHLGIRPEVIADDIILVGDQYRVEKVSQFFDTVEHRSAHREFVCHTGRYNGKRISVLSTGIGTDNIDIVVNELDALASIDLHLRKEKVEKRRLRLLRIGTCGILQAHIPVHSYILSTAALGFDNIAHFYKESGCPVSAYFKVELGLPDAIHPYFATASSSLLEALSHENVYSGITLTSSGFYGPQGRSLRLGTRLKELYPRIESASYNGQRIVNFEMESSALFFLAQALGHQAGTICLGIANRPTGKFSEGYAKEMDDLIRFVLDRF